MKNVVEEIVDAAQVSTAATTVIITTEEVTLAQALAKLKSIKPKAKGIVLQEPGKSTTTTTISSKGLSQDKGKGILVEPEKPLKKKDQFKLDEEIALKLQAEIDKEERIARAEEEKIDEANIAWDDIQAKVDAKTINGEVQLHALVDGKKIIVIESIVRRDLQLEDAEGIDCLPNSTIFKELTRMGYEKISQKLTFYKAFFSPQWKFLIHTIL
ncbi:hypothetical protein Tco_0968587 [Tanacetum coccineum]